MATTRSVDELSAFNERMRAIFTRGMLEDPDPFDCEPTAEERRRAYLERIAYEPGDPSPARLNPVL